MVANADGPDTSTEWRCAACGFAAPGTGCYADLLGGGPDATSEHYSLQWGEDLGFLEFLRANPAAKAAMPASQLGWDRLFARIRKEAAEKTVRVYDAGCGYGGIASELVDESTALRLAYVGADVHGALARIPARIPRLTDCGLLLRWDFSRPLPVHERFDYVICRAALHHAADPEAAFSTLCAALRPGGTIAVSVYARKPICREASDDALRAVVAKMSPEEAFAASDQFTVLGKALQLIGEAVEIPQDLPLLGIKRGRTTVHALVYDHFLKCFHNPAFGDLHSTLVNYDWYHPPHAHRYARSDVERWFASNGIAVHAATSIPAQHYVEGTRGRA